MITSPTVLILGAWASMPYGFPSGKELKDKICENIIDKDKWFQLVAVSGKPPGHFIQLRKYLKQSNLASIDAFLEHRPQFSDAGKICIAQSLLPLEQPDKMQKEGAIDGRDWYLELYSMMIDQCSSKSFPENKLSVITFNYERSFEHFFYS